MYSSNHIISDYHRRKQVNVVSRSQITYELIPLESYVLNSTGSQSFSTMVVLQLFYESFFKCFLYLLFICAIIFGVVYTCRRSIGKAG